MSFDDFSPEFSAPDINASNEGSDSVQNELNAVQLNDNFPIPESHSPKEENDSAPEPIDHEEIQSKQRQKSSLEVTNEDARKETVKSSNSLNILEGEHTQAESEKEEGELEDEEKEDKEDVGRETIKSRTSQLDDESPQFSIKDDQVSRKMEDDGRGMSVVSELLGGELARARSSEDASIDLETFMRGSIKVDDSTMGRSDTTSVQTTPSVAEKIEHRTVSTLHSPSASRPRHSTDAVSINGDFMTPDIIVNMPDETSSETSSSAGTNASSSEIVKSSTEEHLDRTIYYESYTMFNKQCSIEKARNDFLHNLVAEYYRKRKMFHVLAKETKTVTEAHKKYNKYLEELDNLQDNVHAEEDRIMYELDSLKNKCRLHNDQANALLEKLQHAEFDVAKEFVDSESSKGTAEKIVERFIKRQRLHLTNLVKMRLSYIKCKNHLIEKQNQLEALDNLGSNFHLIDYEQLKHDNRNLKDKLEEKDKELTRIREKCQNAMQILAHRREKAAAMDADIKNMAERLEFVTDEYVDVREQLNLLKQERDGFRDAIRKMKGEAGLLAKPKLLRDMELAISEVGVLSEKVNNSKKRCWEITVMVNNMRRSMGSKTKLQAIRKEMLGGATGSKKSTSTSSTNSEFKLEALFA